MQVVKFSLKDFERSVKSNLSIGFDIEEASAAVAEDLIYRHNALVDEVKALRKLLDKVHALSDIKLKLKEQNDTE